MASGYLGKISAVVSANTSGYVRTLNEAAKETKSFARTVQTDISRASNDAKRAFDSMFTPIQRVQRALSAASSQKLSFKGFDGGIKTVDQLNRQLKKLRDNTRVALQVTGKESLTKLRQEFDSLGSDVQQSLTANFDVGSIQEVRRLLDSVSDTKAIEAAFGITGASSLDDLIEKLDTLDAKDVQIVLDVINQTGLAKARLELEQLTSVAQQIATPLGRAAKEFSQLGTSVQAGFIPALSSVQNEVSEMERAIKSGTRIAENDFSSLSAKVIKVTDSVRRLAQASSIVGSFSSGKELEFTDPSFVRSLNAAQRAGARASAQAGQGGGSEQMSRLVRQINLAAERAQRLQANLERARAIGLPNDIAKANSEFLFSIKALDNLTDKLQVRNAQDQVGLDLMKQREQIMSRLIQQDAESGLQIGNNQELQEYLANIGKLADQELRLMENRKRIAAANKFLTVDTENSIRPEQNPAFVQANAQEKAAKELGTNVTKAARDMDRLKSRTVGVRNAVESLPKAVQAGLIPSVKRAEAEFIRLRTSAGTTDIEIERAGASVDKLSAKVKRIAATQGLSTFAQAFEQAEIRSAIGSLNALEQILLRTGATADGKAAAAFDRMRSSIIKAAQNGSIGTDRFARKLQNLQRQAAAAAASTGKISANKAFEQIKRGGDVSRQGFDKLSLGLQQAAFAIDDFFSATGDISQKIRAVQNNVTQLAFVVGGTKGLFIGLGVAIAAQAGLALVKFMNNGVDAADKTKALNDQLENSKNLAEQLAEAFDSLSGTLSEDIFGDFQKETREFQKSIKELVAAQKEVREDKTTRLDPKLSQLREEEAKLKRQSESKDLGQRLGAETQLELNRAEQARRRSQIASSAEATADELRRGLLSTVGTLASSRGLDSENAFRDQVNNAADAEELRSLLQSRINAISEAAARDLDFFGAAGGIIEGALGFGADNVGNLGESTNRFDETAFARQDQVVLKDLASIAAEQSQRATDEIIASALEFSGGVSSSLVQAKEIVESSLESFDSVAVERNRLAERFAEITDKLTDPDANLTQEQAQSLRDQQEALSKQIEANLSAARSAETFAETLNRVAGNLADTLLSEATSESDKARRELNKAIGQREALGPNATDEQRRKADRDVESATLTKELADDDRKRARDERQAIKEDTRKEQEKFNRDARLGLLAPEAQRAVDARDQADRQVARIQKERDEVARIAIPIIREPLLKEADQQLADAQRIRQETQERTAGTLEDAFEARSGVQDLRNRADEVDQELAKRQALREKAAADAAEKSASIERGREITLSDSERRGIELERQATDIENALKQELDANRPDAALQGLNNARASFFQGTMMAGFQQERRNALLQGPSRAALKATDITTTEGQSELNRLIRGDDSALDVNLVELQKQSDELSRVNERLDQIGNNLGIL